MNNSSHKNADSTAKALWNAFVCKESSWKKSVNENFHWHYQMSYSDKQQITTNISSYPVGFRILPWAEKNNFSYIGNLPTLPLETLQLTVKNWSQALYMYFVSIQYWQKGTHDQARNPAFYNSIVKNAFEDSPKVSFLYPAPTDLWSSQFLSKNLSSSSWHKVTNILSLPLAMT